MPRNVDHDLRRRQIAEAVRETPPALERLVADLLAHGRDLGEVPAHIDTAAEAAFLVAGAEGLQASTLLGQHTTDQAIALIDHQLNRPFTASPAGAAAGSG